MSNDTCEDCINFCSGMDGFFCGMTQSDISVDTTACDDFIEDDCWDDDLDDWNDYDEEEDTNE